MVINATNIRNNITSQIAQRNTMSPYVIVTAPWIESQPMEPRSIPRNLQKICTRTQNGTITQPLSIDVTQKDILYKSSLLPLINIEIRDDDSVSGDQQHNMQNHTKNRGVSAKQYNAMETCWSKPVQQCVYKRKATCRDIKHRVRHVGNAAPEKVNTEVVNEKQIGAYILRSQEARDLMGIPEELATSHPGSI